MGPSRSRLVSWYRESSLNTKRSRPAPRFRLGSLWFSVSHSSWLVVLSVSFQLQRSALWRLLVPGVSFGESNKIETLRLSHLGFQLLVITTRVPATSSRWSQVSAPLRSQLSCGRSSLAVAARISAPLRSQPVSQLPCGHSPYLSSLAVAARISGLSS